MSVISRMVSTQGLLIHVQRPDNYDVLSAALPYEVVPPLLIAMHGLVVWTLYVDQMTQHLCTLYSGPNTRSSLGHEILHMRMRS